jgi:hypothetical protein
LAIQRFLVGFILLVLSASFNGKALDQPGLCFLFPVRGLIRMYLMRAGALVDGLVAF